MNLTARFVFACCSILPWLGINAEAQMTDVLTHHNDNGRTGQTVHEEILTLANVNTNHFGKLRVLPTDGKVDAQPLYVAGVSIPGRGVRNVLFVASEHDSVYAFDADSAEVFWQVSVLGAGETPSDALSCPALTPEIGITATPVIDRSLGPYGTIFLVAMSKDASGHYFQRLHALDLATGTHRLPPVLVTATYPGTGDGSTNGQVVFDPRQYAERASLLLVGGGVYTTWTSHCDAGLYTGWIIGYDEQFLVQTSVLNLTPNGSKGAIWMSGAGPAADAAGNIFLMTGNGTFDTTLDSNGFPSQSNYGNAFLKLSVTSNQLSVADYFGPHQTILGGGDGDLGSGGVLLLPDLLDSQANVRQLAVGGGKDQNFYVVDRSNLGKFNALTDSAVYQELFHAYPGGTFSSPAYFNGVLYQGSVAQPIQALPFQNARLTSASSQTQGAFAFPGATPSISANGTNNGIVWAPENTAPAVLHAYATTNLAQELYNSSQATNGADHFGDGNKFITPTIASGRVYVGTTAGVGVFGLLDSTTLTPLQTWRQNHFANPSNVGAGADNASPAGDGLPNLIKYALGLNPLIPAAFGQFLNGTIQSTNGQQYIVLTIDRQAKAPDITYVVQVSNDLKTWASGAPNTVTLSDTNTRLIVRDNTPVGLAPRFIRLAVTNP